MDADADLATDDVTSDADKVLVTNPLYEPNFYLKQIPTDEKLIDSLGKDRNFAYYQLGIIYKEKFKEYELAASRLQQLLKKKVTNKSQLFSLKQLSKNICTPKDFSVTLKAAW